MQRSIYLISLLFCLSSAVAENSFANQKTDFPAKLFSTFTATYDENQSISNYSYQAAVVYNISKSVLPGAIIHKKYIITSALYPIFSDYSSAKVIVGENYFDSIKNSYDVEEIIVHPKFSLGSEYNVALLKLSEPIRFSKNIRKILISSNTPEDNTEAFVTTWRRSDNNGYDLQKYETFAINKNKCKLSFVSSAVSKTSICTEKGNISFNLTDSGAPLVQKNKLVGLYQGVPSLEFYGKEESTELPHVFTDLSTVKEWIEEVINH